ncbi:metal ABC transporter permease [uncultured Actinomyces sp.]|uniref:metal ABC transporter permease n=1 Tax=uncultured Actinomyces sp. TaxID=249061 RepID=UPI0028EBEAC2|nr:metal ABC transporter permease [uncultured Actinomyces sp.]
MILSLLIVPALHVTLIGALGGLVGAFAYLDRRIFFAESVTHGTFPGAVLGVVVAASLGLGHSGMSAALYVGAFLGTIPLVALMRYLASIPGISSQGAAGIVLTAGFAAGYFLATWFKPLPLAVSSFLTGSVMTVSPADVWWAGAVLLLAAVLVAVGHRQLLAHCFDPVEPGAARGAARNERIILGLILAAVTVAIPAVGTILSIALIAAPAAALAPSARSARSFLIGCPLLGAALGLAGLGIAVPARLSAGGTIALLCAACVLASRVPAWMRARGTARPRAAVASH